MEDDYEETKPQFGNYTDEHKDIAAQYYKDSSEEDGSDGDYDSDGNYVGSYGNRRRQTRNKEDHIYGNVWEDNEADSRPRFGRGNSRFLSNSDLFNTVQDTKRRFNLFGGFREQKILGGKGLNDKSMSLLSGMSFVKKETLVQKDVAKTVIKEGLK